MCRRQPPYRTIAIVIAFVVITLSGWSQVAAANYTFTKIADDTSGLNSLDVSGPSSINDSGEVVFRTSGGSPGIYKGSGGTLTTIATNTATHSIYGFFSSINNLGDVVYTGEVIYSNPVDKFVEVYKWSNGTANSVYSMNYIEDPFFYNAAINNSGAVAFVSDPNSFHSGYNYYLVDELGLTVLPGGSNSNCCWESPEINDGGQVLYWKKSVGSTGYELERYDDPGVTPITSGFSIVRPVTMNNFGDAAFVTENGGQVQVFRDGAIQTIAGPDQGFASFATEQGAYINDSGRVAFYGRVSFTPEGIYTGPDLVSDRVIRRNDLLFGVPVTSLKLGGLNNNGQVLFMARLGGATPYNAIVVATPIPVVPLAGDYNGNGTVDTADYTVWRNNLGAPAGTLLNDMDGGAIGTAQYATWKAHFGQTIGTGSDASSLAAVPEPATLVLMMFSVAIGCLWRRPTE